jgi:hypothetical protein
MTVANIRANKFCLYYYLSERFMERLSLDTENLLNLCSQFIYVAIFD